MIPAQGVLEAQQVILVGTDELDDTVIAVAGAVLDPGAVGGVRGLPISWAACWEAGALSPPPRR